MPRLLRFHVHPPVGGRTPPPSDLIEERPGPPRARRDPGRTSLSPRRAAVAVWAFPYVTNLLLLETNLFNLVGPALQAKGHDIREVTGGSVGGYQGILFTHDPRLPEPSRWSLAG